MKDITLVSHLQSLQPSSRPEPADKAEPGFAQALGEALQQVNRQQAAADRAIEQVQAGQSPNLHEAMIAMEKADISLRLTVQMRNKILEAYQEILRMQV